MAELQQNSITPAIPAAYVQMADTGLGRTEAHSQESSKRFDSKCRAGPRGECRFQSIDFDRVAEGGVLCYELYT